MCLLKLGRSHEALVDAVTVRTLRPTWPKAHFRVGAALMHAKRFAEAAEAFWRGVQVDADNEELMTAFRRAIEAARENSKAE